MTGDWRDYRPAIWLAMLGIAVILVIPSPVNYIGAIALGGSIGVAIRISQRRRAIARNPPPSKSRSKTRRRK
ncbi:MAG TPA: hypothetical protein VNR66_11395 [Solirubrobacteraceae bacterium]|jgi:hypothetical protein|nr:hypothetical protein [Solirubrobacteraceae bacterium]